MRTVIIGGEAKVHLIGAWVMMLWAKPCAKFLSHHLRIGLKEENFLGDLLSQHLPCIIVEQTLWSTSATSTKQWLFSQRMNPWCARCSHLAWGQQWWNGLMVWGKVQLTPLRSLLECLELALLLVVGFLSPWIPCCLWPCEREKPWRHILIGTGKCLMR